MRAHEFITETRTKGKISKRASQSTRGLNKFRDPKGYDRTYELNRIMMAVASSDGITKPVLDSESWAGRYNTAHPYTKEEQAMLKDAYSAIGSEYTDLNGGDMRSMELDSTNKRSPVATRPKMR